MILWLVESRFQWKVSTSHRCIRPIHIAANTGTTRFNVRESRKVVRRAPINFLDFEIYRIMRRSVMGKLCRSCSYVHCSQLAQEYPQDRRELCKIVFYTRDKRFLCGNDTLYPLYPTDKFGTVLNSRPPANFIAVHLGKPIG